MWWGETKNTKTTWAACLRKVRRWGGRGETSGCQVASIRQQLLHEA